MPPQDGGGFYNSNLGCEKVVSCGRERFGEQVCKLVTEGHMGNFELILGNKVSNKVIVNSKMLHP